MKVNPSFPFNPPLAPLAPRDLQNKLNLPQTKIDYMQGDYVQ